jgi:hypothetical protein
MSFPEQYSRDRTPATVPPGEDYMQAHDRWVGPSTDLRNRKPLSSECLAALSEAATTAGRPLKHEERDAIVKKFL